MTQKDLVNLRLANQQISSGRFTSPGDLAGWMGAMQAQDFRMVRWAFGLRLNGFDIAGINKAINNAKIIRTHLLRPTWHFVSAEDLQWILEISAPRIKSSLKYRQDFLGLTPEILSETNAIISEVLKGKSLAREKIKKELNEGGIVTDNNSLSHILFWAELSGIICSGEILDDKQTYTLIHERIPRTKHYERKEALGILALKYFKSHGPATLKDFGWWSGLTAADMKISLEMAGDELESIEIDSARYWLGRGQQPGDPPLQAWLIPAFDEIIISYTDRSAIISGDSHSKAVSSNGIFRPVVIIENQVAGLWRTVKSKKGIIVEISSFRSLNRSDKILINNAAESYSNFTGSQTEVKYI
jgi:hypothetical protein